MKLCTYRFSVRSASACMPRKRAGFTMLEILLAMTVLVIIMLMLTTIFDQSASTWESGMRETSRALEGRTIINLIAADLELAVMNKDLSAANVGTIDVAIGPPAQLCFYYYDAPAGDERALKAVQYSQLGTTLQKKTWDLIPMSANPYSRQIPSLVELSDKVKENSFKVSTPGGTFTTNMPAWVDIELKLKETANAASDIQVWSFGPNRADDGGLPDDVVE